MPWHLGRQIEQLQGLLIEMNVELEASCSHHRHTPLSPIAMNEREAVVKTWLARNAAIDVQDGGNMSRLLLAVLQGHDGAVSRAAIHCSTYGTDNVAVTRRSWN